MRWLAVLVGAVASLGEPGADIAGFGGPDGLVPGQGLLPMVPGLGPVAAGLAGACQAGTGTWPDDRTFLNDPTDPVTGLIDVGARKYDPTLGLFISADPVLDLGNPQTMTGYTYAADNPVNNSDPTGLMASGGSVCTGSSNCNGSGDQAPPGWNGGGYDTWPSSGSGIGSYVSVSCSGPGCTAANVGVDAASLGAALRPVQSNLGKLRVLGHIYDNLAEQAPLTQYMGEEGARERAMAKAGKQADNLVDPRASTVLLRLGYGLAIAGGAVGAYGEYEQTNGNLLKAIEVGFGDIATNLIGGFSGTWVGSSVVKVINYGSRALGRIMGGAEAGAEDGGALAGPDGSVAGAIIGGGFGFLLSLVGGNIINNKINS